MKRSLSLLIVALLAASVLGQTKIGGTAKVGGTTKTGATGSGGGGGDILFILTQTVGTPRADFTGDLGFRFTAVSSSPPTVSKLCRWKIAGNSQTHNVHLVSCTGGACSNGGTLIATAAVDMTVGTAGGYICASITPVALTASQEYVLVSEETNAGDQWYDNDFVISSTTSGVGTISSPVFISRPSGVLSGVNDSGTSGHMYVGVNLVIQ